MAPAPGPEVAFPNQGAGANFVQTYAVANQHTPQSKEKQQEQTHHGINIILISHHNHINVILRSY